MTGGFVDGADAFVVQTRLTLFEARCSSLLLSLLGKNYE